MSFSTLSVMSQFIYKYGHESSQIRERERDGEEGRKGGRKEGRNRDGGSRDGGSRDGGRKERKLASETEQAESQTKTAQ